MLPKNLRLNKKKEYDRVFKKGKASFNDIAGLKALKNNTEKSIFGFIVSGKVSKKAVERNKVKRRMREIVRLEINNLKQGYDCVIIAQKEAKDSGFIELQKAIRKNFANLKLYK